MKNKDNKPRKKIHGFGILFKNQEGGHGLSYSRKWSTFNKKEKINYIVSIFVYIIVFGLCVYYLFQTSRIHAYFNGLGAYITDDVQKWLLVHVPCIFDTLISIISFFCIFQLLKLLKYSFKFKSQKAKTLTGLTISILDYILFCITLLLILGSWGCDVAALIASAGILTLIIGLGAQSIVGDLVAGLFIAIEGYISVGDIIKVDDFIGTIREIGLRVTIIENLNNYQMIIRNSEISEIINTSRGTTYNKLSYTIPHRIPSDRVNEIFETNLDRIKSCYPFITEIYYLGLVEFTNWGQVYTIAFKSEQNRAIQSSAAINAEVYRMLEEAGVYPEKFEQPKK